MLARSSPDDFEKAGEPVSSITGGEYLVKPESYAHLIKDSIVVILSRSGMTTEILRAARTMSENSNAVFLSVTMKEENDLLPVCQLNLLMPVGLRPQRLPDTHRKQPVSDNFAAPGFSQ